MGCGIAVRHGKPRASLVDAEKKLTCFLANRCQRAADAVKLFFRPLQSSVVGFLDRLENRIGTILCVRTENRTVRENRIPLAILQRQVSGRRTAPGSRSLRRAICDELSMVHSASSIRFARLARLTNLMPLVCPGRLRERVLIRPSAASR